MSNNNDLYWLDLNEEQIQKAIHRLTHRWNTELFLRVRLLISLNRVEKKGPVTLATIAHNMAIPLITLEKKLLVFYKIGFEDFINLADLESCC